jgi:hypothetical protein
MKKIREKHGSAVGIVPKSTSEFARRMHDRTFPWMQGAENDTANSRSSGASGDQKS